MVTSYLRKMREFFSDIITPQDYIPNTNHCQNLEHINDKLNRINYLNSQKCEEYSEKLKCYNKLLSKFESFLHIETDANMDEKDRLKRAFENYRITLKQSKATVRSLSKNIEGDMRVECTNFLCDIIRHLENEAMIFTDKNAKSIYECSKVFYSDEKKQNNLEEMFETTEGYDHFRENIDGESQFSGIYNLKSGKYKIICIPLNPLEYFSGNLLYLRPIETDKTIKPAENIFSIENSSDEYSDNVNLL